MRREPPSLEKLCIGLRKLWAEIERCGIETVIDRCQDWEIQNPAKDPKKKPIVWSAKQINRWFYARVGSGVSGEYARVFAGALGIPIDEFVDRRKLKHLVHQGQLEPATRIAELTPHRLLTDPPETTLSTLIVEDIAATQETALAAVSAVSGPPFLEPVRQWAGAFPLPKPPPPASDEPCAANTEGFDGALLGFFEKDSKNGTYARKAVIGQLKGVSDLLLKPQPATLRLHYLETAAQLAQIAGWMAYDSRMYGLAQRYYLLGLRFCREAENGLIAGKLLGDLSRLSIAVGNPQEAALLLEAARYNLPASQPGIAHAEIAGMQAGIHARLGRASATRRFIEESYEAAEQSEDSHLPIFRFRGRGFVNCLATTAYMNLARASDAPTRDVIAQAEKYALEALKHEGKGVFKRQALAIIRLMDIRLLQGEPHEALSQGLSALELAIQHDVRATRISDRLVYFLHDLRRRYPGVPPAHTAAFEEGLRTYLGRIDDTGALRL